MQQTLERMAESERTNMNALYTVLWPLIDEEVSFSPHLSTIRQRLGPRNTDTLVKPLSAETIARLPGGLSEQIAIKGRSSW